MSFPPLECHLEDPVLLSYSLYKVSNVGMLARDSIPSLLTDTSISNCLHGGERDGDSNRAQGDIQLASKSGMRAGLCMTAAEKSKKY